MEAGILAYLEVEMTQRLEVARLNAKIKEQAGIIKDLRSRLKALETHVANYSAEALKLRQKLRRDYEDGKL